ncbi:rhodanese-like domain-containing protein [endosymbiont of unidentified scaly snail isolate Monju]|uniref:rhodanese-like domain-containing protein n=1 Tax=endosymbiont of unidentified scaly snail isolate Monju TaxID=1248727 RepID=UPI0003891A68|nr:rhodanese-like domain-containing protein [endosymbiont of unidentified scaly snail isolate Monju]BAN69618.1 rhodanese domain protein [endosymbiont of unidentified scaly snail isolate Monju]
MKRKTYKDLVAEITPHIKECFPWDVEERMERGDDLLFLDVRETHEYDTMHIEGSLNVPRGILETAVEWDHEETEPELVKARNRQVVVVCRSGSRSVFATWTLMQMGYKYVTSLKTGLRGWNEYDLPLVDLEGNRIDPEVGDRYFANKLLDYQRKPADWVEPE